MKRIPEAELELLPIVLSVAIALPLLQKILMGGMSRHITEAYAQNDLEGVTRIVSSQIPLLLIGSLLILLIGGLVGWNINHILDIAPAFVRQARIMTLLVVGRTAIGTALVPFTAGLFANQRFVLQNLIEIAGSILRIVLMLVLILGVGPQVEWVILAQVTSMLFVQITQAIVSMRLMPALRYQPGCFDWTTCKQVISFGGWNFVTDSANLIRRAADAPILNMLSTPLAVNNFFLGSFVETQLRQFAIRASEPLLPALTAMHAHDQKPRLAAAYLRGGRISLWASLFMAVPLIVFGHDYLALYLGSEYEAHTEAATVMILLLLGFPLTYPTMMFSRICFARGDIRPVAVRSIAAQLGNLALTLLLVGVFHMGAIGSATATLVSFAVIQPCFFWPLAIHTLGLSWHRFIAETLVPGLIPAVVAGCAGLVTSQLVTSALSRATLGTLICLLFYAAALLLVLKPADRADLGRIRRIVRR